MALVVAQKVPTSSITAVPYGPAGVSAARRRIRKELYATGLPEPIIDDAVLILSELLSNAYRHGRPLHSEGEDEGTVRAAWHLDKHGRLTVEVTDGGSSTRPHPATPSVTARGGRGLSIVTSLAKEWGVRYGAANEVTVWALLIASGQHGDSSPCADPPAFSDTPPLGLAEVFGDPS